MDNNKNAVALVKFNNKYLIDYTESAIKFPSIKLDKNESISEFEEELGLKPGTLTFWKDMEYWDDNHKIKMCCYTYEADSEYVIIREENGKPVVINPRFHSCKQYYLADIKNINLANVDPENRIIAEFLNTIPNLDKVDDGEDLLGQVYFQKMQYSQTVTSEESLHISLINKRMIEMEWNCALSENYFPLYFYEFIGERIIHINQEFKGRLLEADNILCSVEEYRNQDPTSILAIVEGYVLFSSSPIIEKKGKTLVITTADKNDVSLVNRLNKKILAKAYSKSISNNKIIASKLNSIYGGIAPSKLEVRIYNVGQGNCCYADIDGKKLFFDIGVTYFADDLNLPLVKAATDEIKTLRVDEVILSHWDMDHILGVSYNQDCLYNKTWIVPDIKTIYGKKPNLSITRLFNFLVIVGNSQVYLVNTSDTNKELYKNSYLSIFLGTPKSHHGINKANNGGLILKLKRRRSILLPGDCDNQIIPKEAILDEYENVLISHHGSEMSDPTVIGKNKRINTAFISRGKTYGNFVPDTKIEDKYLKVNFKYIRRTDRLKKYPYYKIML